MKPKPSYSSVNRVLNPEGRIGQVRLEKNEHTVGLPEELVREALRTLTPEFLASYPEVRPLYAKLAEFHGLEEANFMLASGSDAAIKATYEMFVSPGDEVVLLNPTYAMFHVYAKMFGAKVTDIPYGADLALDTDAILAAIHPDVRMLAIPNPNSPTGTIIEPATLLRIIETANDAGVVTLIDEAYHPFYAGTVLPLVDRYDHLAVTRTFSKAYGLASLRLGYMAGGAKLIDLMMKIRPMYEINAVAAHFGAFILDHMDAVDAYVEQVDAGKAVLDREMRELGFEPYETHANFMLIRIDDDGLRGRIAASVADEGILIAGRMGPPMERCIRITLGPPEQMRAVAKVIADAVAERTWP
jgi:histidinol-phosphate aminotransferase